MNGKHEAARKQLEGVGRRRSRDDARLAMLGAAGRKLARPSYAAPDATRLAAITAAAQKQLRRD